MAEIQRISHTHDQIMNWLIANPERSLRECADAFGYTQSWLSCLIHSDVFQAKFRERQDSVFSRIASNTEEKLTGLANMVAEKLSEKVEASQDPKFLLDSFDKIMHRAGYAPNSKAVPQAPTVQNNFFVSRSELEQARASIVARSAPQTIEGKAEVLPSERDAQPALAFPGTPANASSGS